VAEVADVELIGDADTPRRLKEIRISGVTRPGQFESSAMGQAMGSILASDTTAPVSFNPALIDTEGQFKRVYPGFWEGISDGGRACVRQGVEFVVGQQHLLSPQLVHPGAYPLAMTAALAGLRMAAVFPAALMAV